MFLAHTKPTTAHPTCIFVTRSMVPSQRFEKIMLPFSYVGRSIACLHGGITCSTEVGFIKRTDELHINWSMWTLLVCTNSSLVHFNIVLFHTCYIKVHQLINAQHGSALLELPSLL